MQLSVDLHSHSSYAGGVGKIDLRAVSDTMCHKGISVYGVGDCLFPSWQQEYRAQLSESRNGLYTLPGTNSHFIRQTEVIFTAEIAPYRHRIVAHHIILFPDDRAIQNVMHWMEKKGHKNTIARPFFVCQNSNELVDSLYEIQAFDPLIEIIPAHILTPDGVLGSKNRLADWSEFYGSFTEHIHAVETGLSADPEMLCRIPDLQERTFLSNSDCHSAALNRVGREFTILDTSELSYTAIIEAIRWNKVTLTAEFQPSEGRYYLTGHRADKHASGKALFFAETEANPEVCPDCGKPLLMGARNRALELSDATIVPRQREFLHLLPLIDVIAFAHHTKSITSRKVRRDYDLCIKQCGTEIALWQSSEPDLHYLLDKSLPSEIISQIVAVKKGNFVYDPPGYDGCYGNLTIL